MNCSRVRKFCYLQKGGLAKKSLGTTALNSDTFEIPEILSTSGQKLALCVKCFSLSIVHQLHTNKLSFGLSH